MSISQALANFLSERAQPTASFDDEFDNAFVSELLSSSTTDDWREDKIGIFIEVKNYSSSYINFRDAVKDLKLYQHFYDLVLSHLLQCNFEEAVRQAQKKGEECASRMKEIVSFIETCFLSFVNDSVYNHTQDINDQLKACSDGVDLLINQLKTVSEGLNQAKAQQKLILKEREEAKKQQEEMFEQLRLTRNQQEDMILAIEDTHDEYVAAIQNAEEEIQEQSRKITETSTSVLGVFVGVVMVFFGGFTILENVISGIGTLSIYRLSFTMLLFGLILFDIVVLLFYLISRMTGKTVACQCPTNPSNECSKCIYCKRLKFICRFENTMPYVYWGNVAILFCLLFVFLLKSFANGGAAAPEFFSQTLPASLCTGGILLLFTVIQHWALGRKKKGNERIENTQDVPAEENK